MRRICLFVTNGSLETHTKHELVLIKVHRQNSGPLKSANGGGGEPGGVTHVHTYTQKLTLIHPHDANLTIKCHSRSTLSAF